MKINKKWFLLGFIVVIVFFIMVFRCLPCHLYKSIKIENGVTKKSYYISFGDWPQDKRIIFDRTSVMQSFVKEYKSYITAEGGEFKTVDEFKEATSSQTNELAFNDAKYSYLLDQVYGGASSFFEVYTALKIFDGKADRWAIIEKDPAHNLKNLFLVMDNGDLYFVRKFEDQVREPYLVWKKLKEEKTYSSN